MKIAMSRMGMMGLAAALAMGLAGCGEDKAAKAAASTIEFTSTKEFGPTMVGHVVNMPTLFGFMPDYPEEHKRYMLDHRHNDPMTSDKYGICIGYTSLINRTAHNTTTDRRHGEVIAIHCSGNLTKYEHRILARGELVGPDGTSGAPRFKKGESFYFRIDSVGPWDGGSTF